jgi:hypothetical protein
MVLELIYTSAPRTLDGAGYGVVAKSEGLPGSLERFLQRFNRYDFDLSGENGEPSTCPAVFSHATFRESARVWHVMSRVGVGGIDYTNRWVFLAHHVAVSSDELNNAGIGGLMRNPAMFRSEWDGQLGAIAPRSLPSPVPEFHGRGVWHDLTGDANWARVWVDRTSRHTGKPSFVVVPGDADVLGLFTEAMALMAPDDARRISFITQMVADRDGSDFDWIGLLEDSKLARDAASRFPDRTLDLAGPMGPPPISIPQQAPTHKAKPRSTTTAAFALPTPPVKHAEDFDDYPVSDALPANGRRSSRRDREPSAPPPPPPPARAFDSWYVGPLLFVAGVAVTSVLGTAAWKLGVIAPAQPKAEAPQKLAQTEQHTDLQTEKPRDSAPAEPAPSQPPGTKPSEPRDTKPSEARNTKPSEPRDTKPSEPRDSSKRALVSAETTLNSVPRGHVIRIQQWLAATLEKAPKDDWAEILNVDERILPPRPYLRLLISQGSGLDSPSAQEESEIEVRRKEEQSGPVKMRLRDGHVLEFYRDEKVNLDVLDRLAYCVLHIGSRLDDPKSPQSAFSTLRVILTPALPAVPLSRSAWAMDPDLEGGANAFFKLTDKLQKKELDARIRIRRMTLSFLPGDETGWPMDQSKEKRAESLIGKELVRAIEILRDEAWAVDLNVTTHFDRRDRTIAAIVAQLAEHRASSKGLTDEPTDEDNDFIEREPPFGGGDASKEKRRAQPNQRKAKAAKAAKKANADLIEINAEPNRELRNSELGKIDSHALIIELFRRYGRLYGSVVVRIQDEDVEILTFGKAPIMPKP